MGGGINVTECCHSREDGNPEFHKCSTRENQMSVVPGSPPSRGRHKESWFYNLKIKSMNKEELLQGITLLSQEKRVSRAEVLSAFDRGAAQGEISAAPAASFDMADIMYYLGGGIVAIGIGIFLSQNWDVLNTFTRILSTLGSGVLAYNIGVVLSKQATRQTVGQAFHLIAAIVLPIGLFVTLDEMNVDISGFGVMSMIYTALFGLYFIS